MRESDAASRTETSRVAPEWWSARSTRPALSMATLGFLGLALSCLSSLVVQFGGNPAFLGVLTAYKSLPAELFGWTCFVLALLFVLRSVAARNNPPIARVGVSACVLGALLQCASVGLSIREFILASMYSNRAIEEIALLKADYVLAALGWLLLAIGVLIFQRQWDEGRSKLDSATRRVWRPTFLVLSVAFLCSAAGAAFGLGSYVEWHGSAAQPVLLISYGPQVLTWIAVVAAALVVLGAARRGQLSRRLVAPALLAAVGGLVLTVSTASLLTAVESLYRFREYGWITSFVQIEIVAACLGMLAFAAGCAMAFRHADVSSDVDIPEKHRETSHAAPPYWPRVSAPSVPASA